MRKLFPILLLVLLLMQYCKPRMNKEADYTDSKFKEGQVWAYKTRQKEENSYLIILKVEKYDKQGVVICGVPGSLDSYQ